MKYRSEIDGLRAVAVVPVILFHAGFELFSGGFVGVDVFFVISGYLITSIIVAEMEVGKFSLLNFYERRARRILPALFFVILCSIPAAWFILLPSDMNSFAESVLAVATFSSNIFFWQESGYFDTTAELKPLLHTWSLAVEEQFYILFPLFLLAAWRFGKRAIVWALIATFIISLSVAHWGAYNKPSATFFLLPTRAWELLIGAFAAVYLKKNAVNASHHLNNALSAIGLATILYAVFAYDKATPFPSLYALIPTAGTVLVILFAVRGTLVHSLLSLKWLVGIGLISYSLYLWHQPIFAFMRHLELSYEWHLQIFAGGVLSILASVFSYHLVEKRFRSNFAASHKTILGYSVAGIFSVATIGIVALNTPTRVELTYPQLFNTSEIILPSANFSNCPGFEELRVGGAACRVYGDGERLIVIWGDSHARALSRGIKNTDGYSFVVLNHSGCPPAIGVIRADSVGNASNCSDLETLQNYANFVENLDPMAILFVGRWTLYQRGWQRNGKLEKATHFLAADNQYKNSVDAELSKTNLQNGLLSAVKLFGKVPYLIFVRQPPDLNFLSNRQRIFFENIDIEDVADWHSLEEDLMGELFKRGVTIYDSWGILCQSNLCRLREKGIPLYKDDNHLSTFGANLLFNSVLEELDGSLQTSK